MVETLRVLIIDHYDSYTNNILQLLEKDGQDTGSVDAPQHPAWDATIVRFDQFTFDAFSKDVLPEVDAIILSPGPGRPDNPGDFGFNDELIRQCRVPVLGICLGHQGLGTALGARIIHAPNIKHGQVCRIGHAGTGVLKGLPQDFDAVRYNSLVLDPKEMPSELMLSAWTYDPEDPSNMVVMGVQGRNFPFFGVQWHPESVCSSYGKRVLDNFHDIVVDFWRTNTPLNAWSSRCIVPGARFSDALSACGAIPQTTKTTFPPIIKSAALNAEQQSCAATKPYFVKAVELEANVTAQYVYERFVRNTSTDGDAWLDSAKVRDVHSRNTYTAAATFVLSYSTKTQELEVFQHNEKRSTLRLVGPYFTWLQNFQSGVVEPQIDAIPADELGQTAEVGQPILQVGLIGFFGYEMKRESLPGYHYEPSGDPPHQEDQVDSMHMFSNTVFWLDNFTKKWKVLSLIRRGAADPIRETLGLPSDVGLREEDFDAKVSQIQHALQGNEPSPLLTKSVSIPRFVARDDAESYGKTVEAARAAIKEGESYELTATTRFHSELPPSTDPFQVYLRLRENNPAPYSAFMRFPNHDISIMSSSPERFISIDRDGVAEMKPIKGTIAVSPDATEDQARKDHLATDVKELAENLMIVDLIRADLHNISPAASIVVPKLLKVESYETVHQLVTTIRAQLAPGIGSIQALRRVFPAGSMTGAPKLRSVQILEELEKRRTRGIYSGCLGYICASGMVDQSVVIRTIVKDKHNVLTLGAGGAVTWLSKADQEWEEVLVKARAVAGPLQ